MERYWEKSWSAIDYDRIKNYISSKNPEIDDIIYILHQHNVTNVCDAGCGCGILTKRMAEQGFHVQPVLLFHNTDRK